MEATTAAKFGHTDKNADGATCAHCGSTLGTTDYCPARSALRCSGSK